MARAERRTSMVVVVAAGGGGVTWVGLGPSECCDGYRGKMRIARMLWWLQGWPRTTRVLK